MENKLRLLIRQMIREEILNEEKYLNKVDALTAFFKGKISSDELIKIAEKNFGTQVATKEELNSFLKNKFIQDMMADTYNISAAILIKKVKELIGKIK